MPNLNEKPLSTEKSTLQRLHKALQIIDQLQDQVAELQAHLSISEANHARLQGEAVKMTQAFRAVYKLARL